MKTHIERFVSSKIEVGGTEVTIAWRVEVRITDRGRVGWVTAVPVSVAFVGGDAAEHDISIDADTRDA